MNIPTPHESADRLDLKAPPFSQSRTMNARQARFVAEYLIDLNATRAAVRAGYSAKTAYSIGEENLKKPEIAAAVALATEAMAERTELSQDWVVARLRQVAERCMQAERIGESDTYKFDSAGANRALELLGKHMGMFKDRLDIVTAERNLSLSDFYGGSPCPYPSPKPTRSPRAQMPTSRLEVTEDPPVSPRARGLKAPTRGTRYGNGVGQGDGWGGPAKGLGRGSPPMLIPGCGKAKRESAISRREEREARAEELEDILLHLARYAEREETQVVACVKLHAILVGHPVARQVTAPDDDVASMTDAELYDELARIGRVLDDAQVRGVAPSLSHQRP